VEETTTLLDLCRAPWIHHGKASAPWIHHGKATMATVEVEDDAPGWRTHMGLEMGRERRLHICPLLRARALAEEEDGGRHRGELGFFQLGGGRLWWISMRVRENISG